MGPVPVVGDDETFKNGFTIRAEKCPNRRGVEKVLASFVSGPGVLSWEQFLTQLDTNEIRGGVVCWRL